MIKLYFKYGLPFCSIKVTYKGKEMQLDDILLDTGSGGTVLKMEKVEDIGITIEEDDVIETISGVGGSEFVYKKYLDSISLGDLNIDNFKVEIGVMDYGFDINGILGMNFLKSIKAIIDLERMVIKKSL
ncbi:retropepsin-like aspartic protease [Clostridium grantii]|uniref:Aspartyl protease n=1 Tax=Clostridium grantii DSM 8605 TaxID=1121316 RepID=A0A1M5Y1Y4_9CLOT|nr:retropepsin-like aspartic protease [Clostridium grantii]SHI06057.1 Aspartyl protease [Clostridium grantii DSM 8605]